MNNIALALDFNIEELQSELNIAKAEYSFYEFFKQAWPIIEGQTPFIDSWHIGALAEHLEACTRREIRNLIINVPPRTSKSSLLSIAFPAWVWANNPHERFLYASYVRSLSYRLSNDCRRLITSEWYQERWGNIFQLMKDQNAKGRFDNNKKGYRIATSVGAAATGEGASFLICDDPNSTADTSSDAMRENANIWWSQVWASRLNNAKNDVKIVVQQRIHELDVTGFIMDNDAKKNWLQLVLPMEFEENRKSSTIILPSTKGQIWCDPRTKEGELLSKDRFSLEEIDNYKSDLGSYGYAGQYQQRPAPIGGGIIKQDWFQWWKDTTPPQIEFTLQSWDTALTGDRREMISDLTSASASYSACTTWGIFYDENYIANIILLSMWRDRIEYPELRERAKRLYFDYRDIGKEKNPLFKGRPIDMCLIEAKASGEPLMRDLLAAGIRAIPYNPTKLGGKTHRVLITSSLIEGGRVWLPARPPHYTALLPFAADFLTAVSSYPSPSSKDIVDTMSQALQKFKDGNFLSHPKDERPTTPSHKEIKVY